MLKGDTLLLKSSHFAKVKGFSAYFSQYFKLLIKSTPDYFSLKTSLSLLQKNLLRKPIYIKEGLHSLSLEGLYQGDHNRICISKV